MHSISILGYSYIFCLEILEQQQKNVFSNFWETFVTKVEKATFDFFEQLLSNFLRNYGQLFGKSRATCGKPYSRWGGRPAGVLSRWGGCPSGMAVPLGWLSRWGGRPAGVLSRWGGCPSGVAVPLGWLSRWGVVPLGCCPAGVVVPLGWLSRWGGCPDGVLSRWGVVRLGWLSRWVVVPLGCCPAGVLSRWGGVLLGGGPLECPDKDGPYHWCWLIRILMALKAELGC